MVEGPVGRAIVCVRVCLSTVWESANVLMISRNVSCNSLLLVLGMMGLRVSASGELKGEIVVQSMSGRLKSPVIHMCLSLGIRERDVCSSSK